MRLFFALWPDAAVREALAAGAVMAQDACGGRSMQARNLHMTLAFLGETDAAHRDAAIAAAAHVHTMPFALSIDRSGYFKQGRERGIVWVGCTMTPELSALVAGLRTSLESAGVGFDRKPFVPHVTLLRDARAPTARMVFAPVPWTVRHFVLIASTRDAQGPRYRIDSGPLGAAP